MSNPFSKPRPPRSILAASLVAATMALAYGSTAAVAADMPMKAPAAPPYQWTGCYGGFNVGAGASGTNFTDTNDPADGNGSADGVGFLGGGQAGCNLQIGTIVSGLEGDFDYFRSNPNFLNNTIIPPGVQQSLTTNYLATVRPRFGIAADRNLAYLTGGVAFANASYTDNNMNAPGVASASRTLTGWTAGAGWEFAVTPMWTFRLEYLFAAFPRMSAVNAAVPFTGTADLTVQVLRAGVNYKF